MSLLTIRATHILAQAARLTRTIPANLINSDPFFGALFDIALESEKKLDAMVRAERGFGIGDIVLDINQAELKVLHYEYEDRLVYPHIVLAPIKKNGGLSKRRQMYHLMTKLAPKPV